MSMLEREFAVGGHPEVAVTVSSSSVSVAEGEAGTITLEAEGSESGLEGLMVAQIGDVVTIASRKGRKTWMRGGLKISLAVPAGTAIGIQTSSGDTKILGPVSDATVEAASGDVQLASFEGRAGAQLWAVSAEDGEKLAEYAIEKLPVFDGLIASGGRLYLSMEDGELRCYTEK